MCVHHECFAQAYPAELAAMPGKRRVPTDVLQVVLPMSGLKDCFAPWLCWLCHCVCAVPLDESDGGEPLLKLLSHGLPVHDPVHVRLRGMIGRANHLEACRDLKSLTKNQAALADSGSRISHSASILTVLCSITLCL
jgi:hypothetical protein